MIFTEHKEYRAIIYKLNPYKNSIIPRQIKFLVGVCFLLIYTDLLQNGLAQIDASPDSLYVESDTLKPDTVRTSINGESDPASFLDEPVDYEAKDS